MSISFGGLGIMALRRPFVEWSDMVLGRGEIRSMLCVAVSFLVSLVLAYLTNPSEISFRAYLTEQSFRQHLSRLDDNGDDDTTDPEDVKVHYSLSSRGSNTSYGSQQCDTNTAPFHFANRASVSLRTPKHVFHSFGVFTIAAVIPITRSCGTGNDRNNSRDAPLIADSWFIGAFGRWWRGGVIEAWYHDMVSGTKDEEGWSSGILGMKALDKHTEFDGLPYATTTPARLFSRGTPPKLRNRERSSQRQIGLPTRNSSPPPLPKSASLPLHATRPPTTIADHKHITVDKTSNGHHAQLQPAPTSEQIRLTSAMHSRTPSGLFDQSPLIADVLRQISMSKSTVHDLRTQLTDLQTAASQTHASLQGEVDSYRERKRQEDASKLELKSRTKTLEDSKRSAESNKRDAEKRLKAAQSASDDASQRMARLDKEISELHQRMADDESSAQQSKETTSNMEQEICEALEHKKHEIKVAEDVITALNARARELEDKIAAEKERLGRVREAAEVRKQDRSFYPLHVVNKDSSVWSPISYGPYETSYPADHPEQAESLSTADTTQGLESSEAIDLKSPRPMKLSLGSLSNFNHVPSEFNYAALRAKGYSIFDSDLASLAQLQRSNFSPFAEPDAHTAGTMFSPSSSSLIPTSLIQSLDGRSSENVSRSFQPESEIYFDPEWRPRRLPRQATDSSVPVSTSPTSLTAPSFNENDSAFEVRQSIPAPESYLVDNLPRMLPSRTHSDPITRDHGYSDADFVNPDKASPRRWFSTLAKERTKKGLNPDAKVFRLNKKAASNTPLAPNISSSLELPNPSYDALNPTGLSPSMISSTTPSTNTSLLRAFAPSPAEREALQRALGGSTNTSFERLPSLSDVGSIPSSPSHVHAAAATHPSHRHSMKEIGSVLPSWLQSLPRIKKSNFSPWDDDEPAGTGA